MSDKLRMINIPYYSKIKKGQRVITSGLSEHYPKDYCWARLNLCSVRRTVYCYRLWWSRPLIFDKLEEVLVIIEGEITDSGA